MSDSDGDKKKDKKEKKEKLAPALSPIAKPLAGKKLTKKLLKLTSKASKQKHVKRGVKEVVKALKKGEKGVAIFAGDISPIDVITHLPVLCEESNIMYAYVPSKEELGTASQTKRPTSCVLITLKDGAEYKDLYEECATEMKEIAAQ